MGVRARVRPTGVLAPLAAPDVFSTSSCLSTPAVALAVGTGPEPRAGPDCGAGPEAVATASVGALVEGWG